MAEYSRPRVLAGEFCIMTDCLSLSLSLSMLLLLHRERLLVDESVSGGSLGFF